MISAVEEGDSVIIYHSRRALAVAAGRRESSATEWKMPEPDARVGSSYGWLAETLREWATDRRPDLLEAVKLLEDSEPKLRQPPAEAARRRETRVRKKRTHD